jgi:DUF971 family protein
MKPIKIKVREKEFLDITWNDGETKSIKLSNLRNSCPCAICHAEKDEWSATYIPLYTKEQLTITKISIIGTYAVEIVWEDGHNTGLYDYEYLYKLFDNFPVVNH